MLFFFFQEENVMKSQVKELGWSPGTIVTSKGYLGRGGVLVLSPIRVIKDRVESWYHHPSGSLRMG